MRSIVMIERRGSGYIGSAHGRFGGGYTGAWAGIAPVDAAMFAVREMCRYARGAPEGGDLLAPPEVLELVPEHLRSVAARAAKVAEVGK